MSCQALSSVNLTCALQHPGNILPAGTADTISGAWCCESYHIKETGREGQQEPMTAMEMEMETATGAATAPQQEGDERIATSFDQFWQLVAGSDSFGGSMW